jgi:hypothetical protein
MTPHRAPHPERADLPRGTRRNLAALDALDALRARLVARVTQLDAPDRARTAPGGGWTPVQVLQHLYLVEAGVLTQVEGATDARPRTPTIRHRVGRLVVAFVLRFGIRVRMPTRRVSPEPPLSLDELDERWPPVSAALRAHLEAAGGASPGAPVMHHPVSGPLDAAATTRFLLGHMQHHERQLDRILRGEAPSP